MKQDQIKYISSKDPVEDTIRPTQNISPDC